MLLPFGEEGVVVLSIREPKPDGWDLHVFVGGYPVEAFEDRVLAEVAASHGIHGEEGPLRRLGVYLMTGLTPWQGALDQMAFQLEQRVLAMVRGWPEPPRVRFRIRPSSLGMPIQP